MNKLWKPALLLTAIAVMVIGMLGSGAWFTDGADRNVASITSGTLSIDNGKIHNVELATLTNMVPGQTTGEVSILIENNGNVDLGWFGDIQFSGDETLQDALYIESARMEFVDWTHSAFSNNIDQFVAAGRSPYAYYNGLADATPFKVLTFNAWDNNTGMGAAPYEFNGALKPGNAYKLVLTFGMAKDAGNLYQHLGPVDVKLVVEAKQLNADALGTLANTLPWMNLQIAEQAGE